MIILLFGYLKSAAGYTRPPRLAPGHTVQGTHDDRAGRRLVVIRLHGLLPLRFAAERQLRDVYTRFGSVRVHSVKRTSDVVMVYTALCQLHVSFVRYLKLQPIQASQPVWPRGHQAIGKTPPIRGIPSP